MNTKEVENLYREGLAKGEAGPSFTFAPAHLQMARIAAARCAIIKYRPQSVLDVGCGIGGLIDGWFPGFAYVGVDIVPELIDRASSDNPGVKFMVGEASDVLGRFDMVVSLGVLAHVPDSEIKEFVAQVADKSSNYILLEVQDPEKYHGSFHSHDRERLLALLARHGFKLVEFGETWLDSVYYVIAQRKSK